MYNTIIVWYLCHVRHFFIFSGLKRWKRLRRGSGVKLWNRYRSNQLRDFGISEQHRCSRRTETFHSDMSPCDDIVTFRNNSATSLQWAFCSLLFTVSEPVSSDRPILFSVWLLCDQAVWLGVDIQCVSMGFDVFGTASRACFVTFVLVWF